MSINYRLLSLQITKHCIGISITEHPSKNESQHIIHDLDPIPYLPKEEVRGHGKKRSRISRSMFDMKKQMIKAELSTIINDFNVCGLVVGYPLEETGHPGSACGRVLHLLDYFADAKNGMIIGPKRPATLWDPRLYARNHFEHTQTPMDRWGRSAAFCKKATQDKNVYNVHNESSAYNKIQIYFSNHGKNQRDDEEESYSSNQILKEFLDRHYHQDEDMRYVRHSSISPFEKFLSNYEGNVECLSPSLM
jgi:RNase H-fold protein (predicted Holliday junction resolvase)